MATPRAPSATAPLDRLQLARMLIDALAPLIDLLLQLGITSPEAETLLRARFVRQVRARLQRAAAGKPAASRIALLSGVHRNFVQAILREPAAMAPSRRRRGHRADRLLEAWHRETDYVDANGRPRELPERGPRPSFRDLALRHVPGAAPRAVLEELLRSGALCALPGQRVRACARRVPIGALTRPAIESLAEAVHAALGAFQANLVQADGAVVRRSVVRRVSAQRLPIVRAVIARRTAAYLAGLEAELARESRLAARRVARVTVMALATETQAARQGRGRRDR